MKERPNRATPISGANRTRDMELLSIKHHDFEMTIECSTLKAFGTSATTNVGEETMSTYSWSDGGM